MSYELVNDFAGGLDNRKSPLTAPGGTLTRLTNAMITPGGEIAKRRAFVKVADVPGSFGLATTGTQLYVFGHNVMPPAPVLTADGNALAVQGITFTRRIVPDSTPTIAQTDYDTFDGKVYLTCNGGPSGKFNPHYYDNDGTGAAPMVETEGTNRGYYIRTYQSKIYSVINQYLYFSAVSQPLIWNYAAATLATPVTVTILSSGYPAYCVVAAADIGKFVNGQFVVVSGADAGHAAANGFHRISSVSATYNAFYLDGVNTTTAGVPQTTGVFVDSAPTTGSGYINLSVQDASAEQLTGLEVYYNQLAIFSTEAVQIWTVDPDPLKNQFDQLLRGTSTRAARSPLQYGSGDVLYLDASGIRSLKAKDSSNSASVSDIGSPIDTILAGLGRLITPGNMAEAVSLLEPSIGRFWMVFPNEAYVLSDFPGPKITAWSRITLPFTMTYAVSCGGRLFFRDNADQVWVYGGADGITYDNCGVEIRLPYVSGKKPGHNKLFEAIDMTVEGQWEARVSYDFNNPDAEEVIGTFTAPTWRGGRAELTGYGSHISLRFYNSDANFCSLSNLAVHYQVQDDEQ